MKIFCWTVEMKGCFFPSPQDNQPPGTHERNIIHAQTNDLQLTLGRVIYGWHHSKPSNTATLVKTWSIFSLKNCHPSIGRGYCAPHYGGTIPAYHVLGVVHLAFHTRGWCVGGGYGLFFVFSHDHVSIHSH